MPLSSSGCRPLHEPLSAWKHPPENQCTKQHKFHYTVATVRHGWGGREELQTNLKNGGKAGLLPASSIPPETFPAAQSSIGIPATTFDWDSRSENCLRPASCLWPQTGNTIHVTWPVRCFWYGWSSYSAWPSTVSVRYSWISHRLDPVVHHESLADCQLRWWCVDQVCCLKAAFWDPSCLIYILLMSQISHCAVVWTFIDMRTIPSCTFTVTQWTVQLKQRD